jgi:hypothetical protein
VLQEYPEGYAGAGSRLDWLCQSWPLGEQIQVQKILRACLRILGFAL